MPQSLSRVLIHIVFSTADRRPWINDTIRSELHTYLAGGASMGENVCLAVGGVADHVHIAMFLSRTDTLARIVERLKTASSKWIKTRGPGYARFRWQKGYAVFSVGLGDRTALVEYIQNQEKHHRRRDFQAELRAMFVQYGIEVEERFMWD